MFKFNKKQINELKKKFSKIPNFFLEIKNDSFEKVFESEFLITDWSGIGMEFSFITGRPVIFVNTEKKINNVNFNDIDQVPLEESIREHIGAVIEPDSIEKIDEVIKNFENNLDFFKSKIIDQRKKYIYNFQESKKYIVSKLIELDNNWIRLFLFCIFDFL